jgi:hypothetical protein
MSASGAITESLAFPTPLQGSYFFVDLPMGFGYPIGTPASTVDQGVQYWSGTAWRSTPPNIVIGSPPTVVVTPSGTLPPTILAYNPLGLAIVSTSDNAADLTGDGTNIPSLVVIDQRYGGSNVNDARNGLAVFTDLTAPTSASNGSRFYVGAQIISQAEVPDTGTVFSPQGTLEGITANVQLSGPAENWFALIGAEFTSNALAGSSVTRKALLLMDNFPTDVVQGSHTDSHIWSTAHTGAAGAKTWAKLDDDAGLFPISAGGTLIQLVADLTSPSISTGIDFGTVSVTGNILQWANSAHSISGSGAANISTLALNNAALSGAVFAAQGVAGNPAAFILGSTTTGQSTGLQIKAGTNASDFALIVENAPGTAAFLLINGTGAATFGGPVGVNSATPPAQVTGWGTPTGASVINNFSGSAAPLTTCSAAIAELITIFKALGFLGS